MPTQCKGTNRRGDPCSAHVPNGKQWCPFHDPDLAAERRSWRSEGGRSRSNRARARKGLASDGLTSTELIGALSRAIRGLEEGSVEPGIATAMATTARAITAIRQGVELEERVRELESAAGIVDIRDRRAS